MYPNARAANFLPGFQQRVVRSVSVASNCKKCPHEDYFANATPVRVVIERGIFFVIECKVTCVVCGISWAADEKHLAILPVDEMHRRLAAKKDHPCNDVTS